MDIFL